MAGLDAGRNGIISVMEKGAQWVPLVSPGSPWWYTFRLQISTASQVMWVIGIGTRTDTESKIRIFFLLVLNKP